MELDQFLMMIENSAQMTGNQSVRFSYNSMITPEKLQM